MSVDVTLAASVCKINVNTISGQFRSCVLDREHNRRGEGCNFDSLISSGVVARCDTTLSYSCEQGFRASTGSKGRQILGSITNATGEADFVETWDYCCQVLGFLNGDFVVDCDRQLVTSSDICEVNQLVMVPQFLQQWQKLFCLQSIELLHHRRQGHCSVTEIRSVASVVRQFCKVALIARTPPASKDIQIGKFVASRGFVANLNIFFSAAVPIPDLIAALWLLCTCGIPLVSTKDDSSSSKPCLGGLPLRSQRLLPCR